MLKIVAHDAVAAEKIQKAITAKLNMYKQYAERKKERKHHCQEHNRTR